MNIIQELSVNKNYSAKKYAKLNFSDLVNHKGHYFFLGVAKKIKSITILINSEFFSNNLYWGKILNIITLELKRLKIDNFIYILEDDKAVDTSDKSFSSDAFIFIGAKKEIGISQIIDLKKPHVFIDPLRAQPLSTHISHDNFAAGFESAKKFYELGHRNFCFFDGKFNTLSYDERYDGFSAFLSKNKISSLYRIPLLASAKNSFESYNFSDVLKLEKRPTALFCATDYLLPSIFSILSKSQLSVPQDMSIISFDNSNPHDIDNITVDSYGISIVNMALTALYVLLTYIDSNIVSLPVNVCIDTKLIKRGSTQQANGGAK